MNCSKTQELISAYYDGEMADELRSRISDHLVGCSDCSAALAKFGKLSLAATALSTPAPPQRMWIEIERQLDKLPAAQPHEPNLRRSLPTRRLLAFAATLLVAIGVGWLTRHARLERDHAEVTVHFGHYLKEFGRDPAFAQQVLLTKYEGKAVSPENAAEFVGYRPAVASGLPAGYTVESTHVLKMPCCACVQTLCKRSDGSTLAIFEHDDETTTEWFGDRPTTICQCGGKHCCLVELDDRIAACWKRGERHFTLIGVRDTAEVEKMVAWLDEKRRSLPH